ncbi:MAG: tetratricopeptide repeat protein [Candidatus Omnitrophica bacterium]|nr:tetratricopeptide repeat protein [Candidatus Omnitrophota bacterium]
MNKKYFLSVMVISIFMSFVSYSQTVNDDRFYVAQKAFDDGFYDASLSLFARFIDDFSADQRVLKAKLYIAKCYYFQGKFPESLKSLQALLADKKAESIYDEVYYWLSEVYRRGKNRKESLEFADKVINDYPDSAFRWWAYYTAAQVSFETGENNQAISFLNKVIEGTQDNELKENALSYMIGYYYSRAAYKKLAPFGQQYLKDFPLGPLTAKVFYYLGRSFENERKYDQALDYYEKGLQNSSDDLLNDYIYKAMALTYLTKGEPQIAENSISKIKKESIRLFGQGVYYLKLNKYQVAIEVFDTFLEKYPEDKDTASVYSHKADALYEMGRVKDSQSIYQYLLDNYSKDSYQDTIEKAHYGLAWCYLKTGEFKKAIAEFKYTLEYTDNPIVKMSSKIQIADAYQEEKKYDQALSLYTGILKDNPNSLYSDYVQFQISMVYLKQQSLDKAMIALRNLKENFSNSTLIPEAEYHLAVGYFSQGYYDDAISLLEDFIKNYSNHYLSAKTLYLYGKSFYNKQRYDDALGAFKLVLSDVNAAEIEQLVSIDIGNTYLNLSAFDQAKKTWLNFLTKYPDSKYLGTVALYLGGLFEKDEDFSNAQKYYELAAGDYTNSDWAFEAFLSLGHLNWRRGNYSEAEAYFKKVEESKTPLAYKARLYQAKMLAQQGENQKALLIYDSVINSPSVESAKVANFEKASLLKTMKLYPQAVLHYQKAIDSGLDSAEIRFALAFSLEKNNRTEDAIEKYLSIIYKFNDQEYKVKSYFRIAKLYESDEKIEEAKAVYKKLIELNVSESKIARVKLEELNNKQ